MKVTPTETTPKRTTPTEPPKRATPRSRTETKRATGQGTPPATPPPAQPPVDRDKAKTLAAAPPPSAHPYNRFGQVKNYAAPPASPPAPPPAAPTPAQQRTVAETGHYTVTQEPTGRYMVTFSSRLGAIQGLNRAYHEAAKSGKPVIMIHGASWCKACSALAKEMEKRGYAVIYLQDSGEIMAKNASFPPMSVIIKPGQKDPFTSGKTSLGINRDPGSAANGERITLAYRLRRGAAVPIRDLKLTTHDSRDWPTFESRYTRLGKQKNPPAPRQTPVRGTRVGKKKGTPAPRQTPVRGKHLRQPKPDKARTRQPTPKRAPTSTPVRTLTTGDAANQFLQTHPEAVVIQVLDAEHTSNPAAVRTLIAKLRKDPRYAKLPVAVMLINEQTYDLALALTGKMQLTALGATAYHMRARPGNMIGRGGNALTMGTTSTPIDPRAPQRTPAAPDTRDTKRTAKPPTRPTPIRRTETARGRGSIAVVRTRAGLARALNGHSNAIVLQVVDNSYDGTLSKTAEATRRQIKAMIAKIRANPAYADSPIVLMLINNETQYLAKRFAGQLKLDLSAYHVTALPGTRLQINGNRVDNMHISQQL